MKCNSNLFNVVSKPDSDWIVVFEPKGNMNVVFKPRVVTMRCLNQGNSVYTKGWAKKWCLNQIMVFKPEGGG